MANMHQDVKDFRCNYHASFILKISFVGYSLHVLTYRLLFCCCNLFLVMAIVNVLVRSCFVGR